MDLSNADEEAFFGADALSRHSLSSALSLSISLCLCFSLQLIVYVTWRSTQALIKIVPQFAFFLMLCQVGLSGSGRVESGF